MAVATALALAGIGGKLLGGLFGKKTANSAAAIQKAAADKAAAEAKQVVADTNPAVLDAARTAGDNALTSADRAATGVDTATTNANNLLNPYATAGTTAAGVLNSGIAEGGQFNRTPTAADITIDPGYEWRQKQAQQALERSAGAHGGVDNGGFSRDLARFIGGDASQEYAAAYDRFTRSTQNRFANVLGVAGQGQTAATRQGGNLIDAGVYGGNVRNQATQYAGNHNVDATNLTTGRTMYATGQANEFNLQGANATASGRVAGSNVMWNGINGAINDAQEAYAQSQGEGQDGEGSQGSSQNMFRWGNNKKPSRWTVPVNPGYAGAPGGTA